MGGGGLPGEFGIVPGGTNGVLGAPGLGGPPGAIGVGSGGTAVGWPGTPNGLAAGGAPNGLAAGGPHGPGAGRGPDLQPITPTASDAASRLHTSVFMIDPFVQAVPRAILRRRPRGRTGAAT